MNTINTYMKKEKIKYSIVFTLLVIMLCVFIVGSVLLGSMKISVSQVITVILGKIFNGELLSEIPENVTAVIWEIRVPRILCAALTGMALAVSGVIFQGILKNPLADPYTLGISTGASFGASLAILLNITMGIFVPVSFLAIIFAGITLFFVIITARRGNSLESSNLIISGIIVSSVLSSGISLIKMLAGEEVASIVFWLMGSISGKGWDDVFLLLAVVLIGTVVAVIFSKELDIMALGDKNAFALGVNPHKTRLFYLITGSVLTAVCVSVCGIIGFVGLIVPHLLRFTFSSKNKILIPLSALSGAVLLLLADSITRVLTAGEIPVGVITTLLGGPFFIYIFTKKGGRKNG